MKTEYSGTMFFFASLFAWVELNELPMSELKWYFFDIFRFICFLLPFIRWIICIKKYTQTHTQRHSSLNASSTTSSIPYWANKIHSQNDKLIEFIVEYLDVLDVPTYKKSTCTKLDTIQLKLTYLYEIVLTSSTFFNMSAINSPVNG